MSEVLVLGRTQGSIGSPNKGTWTWTESFEDFLGVGLFYVVGMK